MISKKYRLKGGVTLYYQPQLYGNDPKPYTHYPRLLENENDYRQSAQVILFEHANFRGAHKHVFNQESNLNAPDDNFFNDKVSSIVIISGQWQFYRDWNFQNPYPYILGPGTYPWVEAVGIKNDDMSSLRSV
ncbi:hypothetical protein BK746_00025 [Bacillus thuringiensis serovar yosoo]|uniref:Beta/gamma crystallin 'Greek key' domain-containing protein n=1 Tax=Bacillus thuringiensis serovar yosoo TaxID=180848 RepID=A0A9X6FD78_BACTU|nr:hypothetical protein BK746_00025 [Bacillus thuringiensis serovar yosoo]